ncbi:hypothetical protein GJ496_006241 [Pomphorhynchus laevis]|nr:hypothetical protein GJ496_006241 [Pomphorhynchus laevis]
MLIDIDKPINNPRIVFTENNSKLIIRSLHDQNDNGQYKCIAKNRHGTTSAICEVQSMHVVPPSLTNKPNRNLISYVSGSVTVCCLYSGSPHPHIKWYFGTKKITFYERYSMNADKCLVITNITMADVGEYECVISNIGGTIKHRTHIDVLNPSKLVPNDLLKTLRMKAIIEDNQVTLNTAKYIIKQQLPVMSVNEIKEWLKYGADEIRDLRIAEKVFHFIMSVIREHLERLKDINHFPITQPEVKSLSQIKF